MAFFTGASSYAACRRDSDADVSSPVLPSCWRPMPDAAAAARPASDAMLASWAGASPSRPCETDAGGAWAVSGARVHPRTRFLTWRSPSSGMLSSLRAMPLPSLSARMSSRAPTPSSGESSMAIAACVIGPLSDAASFQKISGLSSESATRAKRALTYGDISTAPSIGLPTSRANGDGGASA